MPIEMLHAHRRAILELATRHGARNVRVFGSIARGDDRPDSDVDLLVHVEPGRSVLDVIALEQDLEALPTARSSRTGYVRMRRCASWRSSDKPSRISPRTPDHVGLRSRGGRLPGCATR